VINFKTLVCDLLGTRKSTEFSIVCGKLGTSEAGCRGRMDGNLVSYSEDLGVQVTFTEIYCVSTNSLEVNCGLVLVISLQDRATEQAFSRRFPCTAARIRARVRSCGICGEQRGTGNSFLRVPSIPPIVRRSSSFITRGSYNRRNSGRSTSLTSTQEIKKTAYKLSFACSFPFTLNNDPQIDTI
jgi:hypothetical protein